MDGWIVWGFVFVFDGPIFVLEVCYSLARNALNFKISDMETQNHEGHKSNDFDVPSQVICFTKIYPRWL